MAPGNDPHNIVGRPSIYTKELGDKICSELAEGKSLRHICLQEGMPEARTVHYWLLDKDKEDFFQQYARARDIQAENMFDEILAISDESRTDIVGGDDKSDNARVQAHRLRVDSRKWYLSKVLPKKFGDKLDMTTNGKDFPVPIYGGNSTIKDA